MSEMAAMLVQVRCGLIPGEAMESQSWGFTREEVEEKTVLGCCEEAKVMFDELVRPAPNTFNWVELSWIWL